MSAVFLLCSACLPPVAGAMASAALVSSAMVEFPTLAASAGAGPDLLAYLEARSLNRTATLALVADTWDAVDTKVFRPFRDGVVVAGTMHKVADDEAPVAQAILRHMWSEARRQWDLFSAPPPRPAPAAPAPSPASASLPPGPGEKPPKGFPEWGRLVDAYNKVLLGGEPRTFPADELLGAEDVLARMHWEHTRDKLYTPVAIGEILSKRTFSTLKVVNPLSARRSTGSAPHQIKLVDGALSVEEDRPMVPKGIWSVVDGLTAIKWAWILIQLGTEKAVVAYVDWWIGKARLRSHQLLACLSLCFFVLFSCPVCWFVPAFCPTFCWRSLNTHHHDTQNWREPHHRILIINGSCCEIFIEISRFLKDSDSDQSLVKPNKYLRYL